jgi:glutathione S-transferase
VPTIADNGALIAESTAIVLFLTDTYPAAGLGPEVGDPKRGEYLTWIAWYAAEMEPAMFAQFGGELANSPHKQRSYDAVVQRLEGALAQGPYVMGDHFTGADLLISSALNFARQAFPESAALDAYAARCKARPAAIRGFELDNASGVQRSA